MHGDNKELSGEVREAVDKVLACVETIDTLSAVDMFEVLAGVGVKVLVDSHDCSQQDCEDMLLAIREQLEKWLSKATERN